MYVKIEFFEQYIPKDLFFSFVTSAFFRNIMFYEWEEINIFPADHIVIMLQRVRQNKNEFRSCRVMFATFLQ